MNKAFVIACLLSLAYCAPKWHQLEGYNFEQYVKDFQKEYAPGSSEHINRRTIFEQNLAEIIAFNRDSSQTYKRGVNKFADMTEQEFKQSIKGYSKEMKPDNVQSMLRNLASNQFQIPTAEQVAALPTNVDWRTQGVVTPVKDQKSCGSCWAFATTATIESHVAINSGTLKVLSPQQLVSCVANPYQCGGSGGCAGATAEVAFNYVQNYGQISDSAYPYSSGRGVTGTCSYDPNQTPAEVLVDGYIKLPTNDYNSLLYASATYGPIAVSVDASKWSSYETGIFNGCSYDKNIDINHAVVLTGYGTDASGDYWLIRNSWGPTYGEDGYIRIARESTVTCGLDSTPSDGVACLGQTSAQQVCGQCAVLFDSSFPLNARVAA